MENGARDAYFTPIYTKKNRPAYKLTVLTLENQLENLEKIIFKNSSTIGIRRYKTKRRELQREILEFDSEYGKIRIKESYSEDIKKYYPEYEDVLKVAKKGNLSFEKAYHYILDFIID